MFTTSNSSAVVKTLPRHFYHHKGSILAPVREGGVRSGNDCIDFTINAEVALYCITV